MFVDLPVASCRVCDGVFDDSLHSGAGNMDKAILQRRQSLQADVEAIFKEALDRAFPNQGEAPIVTPTKPKDAKFGDYQCNNAMKLFNSLKGKVWGLFHNDCRRDALEKASSM